MEFDIETWVPYRCDFKPITTNSLFSEALGRIAALALRVESEFLYMQTPDSSPAGTLVPENLIHPCTAAGMSVGFAMVFSYSVRMEGVLFSLANEDDDLGAGVAACGIWKDSILVDECKTLAQSRLRELTGVNVVGLWEQGRFHLPSPTTVIGPSTVLVLAGSQEQLRAYDKFVGSSETDRSEQKPVLVLGGGRVGMSVAQTLGGRGIDYRVVEKNPTAWGRPSMGTRAVSRRPAGPSPRRPSIRRQR